MSHGIYPQVSDHSSLTNPTAAKGFESGDVFGGTQLTGIEWMAMERI